MKYINDKSKWFFVRVAIIAGFIVSSAWLFGSAVAPFITADNLLFGVKAVIIIYMIIGGGCSIYLHWTKDSKVSDINFSFLATTMAVIVLWPIITWFDHKLKED